MEASARAAAAAQRQTEAAAAAAAASSPAAEARRAAAACPQPAGRQQPPQKPSCPGPQQPIRGQAASRAGSVADYDVTIVRRGGGAGPGGRY